jgi:ABC-type antimicrobial peptide transport system permease subunit
VRVSPSFFPMIGVHAALGRTFRQAEGQPGRDDVVVLSHSLWTRRFGANPGIVGSRVLEDAIAQSVPRFQVELLALFGAIALLLSAIGVYGVTSYGVSQRTREIGIRMSLGATARDVSFDVLHEAALIGVIGVIAGLVGAAALGRVMASMLYGVSPMDGASLATAAVVLFSATILAAYVPARRAARVQPIVALRSE